MPLYGYRIEPNDDTLRIEGRNRLATCAVGGVVILAWAVPLGFLVEMLRSPSTLRQVADHGAAALLVVALVLFLVAGLGVVMLRYLFVAREIVLSAATGEGVVVDRYLLTGAREVLRFPLARVRTVRLRERAARSGQALADLVLQDAGRHAVVLTSDYVPLRADRPQARALADAVEAFMARLPVPAAPAAPPPAASAPGYVPPPKSRRKKRRPASSAAAVPGASAPAPSRRERDRTPFGGPSQDPHAKPRLVLGPFAKLLTGVGGLLCAVLAFQALGALWTAFTTGRLRVSSRTGTATFRWADEPGMFAFQVFGTGMMCLFLAGIAWGCAAVVLRSPDRD